MEIEIFEASAIEIKKLINSIPEFDPTPVEEIEKRIFGKTVNLFAAKENSEFTGFIIACEDSPETYYNWLTGVLPDYRGKAIATKLFDEFEEYATKSGYKSCKVKSMNKFRTMLQLLNKRDYDIVGYENRKIIFEKHL